MKFGMGKMNEIRNIHKKNNFKCSDVCKRFLPRLTEKSMHTLTTEK